MVLISATATQCLTLSAALWLGGVALLHVSLIFLGKWSDEVRHVLVLSMSEIQDSKLHLTSVLEAFGHSTRVDGPSFKLSHMAKQLFSGEVGSAAWTWSWGHDTY